MKLVDSNYDDILDVNYELYALKLSELKALSKSWYNDFDLKAFDVRNDDNYRDNNSIIEMKLSGLVSNYFYAYKEADEYYLLDGYNRLLTDYAQLNYDPIVYIKIIVDKCPDHKLISTMFRLNMWKLQPTNLGRFKTNDFLDRGFRLFLQKKFDINIYTYSDYNTKTRSKPDFDVLDFYFRDEREIACYWTYKLKDMIKLFSHKNVVNDFREIVTLNDYLKEPFKNYDHFLNGYIMFLSWRRVSGDEKTYDFNHYLEILKQDKFYKKLIKMSGTDSTRINVFKFFRRIYQETN